MFDSQSVEEKKVKIVKKKVEVNDKPQASQQIVEWIKCFWQKLEFPNETLIETKIKRNSDSRKKGLINFFLQLFGL